MTLDRKAARERCDAVAGDCLCAVPGCKACKADSEFAKHSLIDLRLALDALDEKDAEIAELKYGIDNLKRVHLNVCDNYDARIAELEAESVKDRIHYAQISAGYNDLLAAKGAEIERSKALERCCICGADNVSLCPYSDDQCQSLSTRTNNDQLTSALKVAREALESYANPVNWSTRRNDDNNLYEAWDCAEEENWNGPDAARRALAAITEAEKPTA